ncbi:hypothetical protein L249_8514 [Ophiocordyceps polyrhachis-furcata BCC 54312]|uniref:Cytochrome P450 n=1 Tax=Ophiocordyceps polyrhachis-furcata BCC 54312 TaxID=1330021 RepID=A0A367L7J8_9HYPO|nr:hypothetical protein L249_8514 [Ophiocordyceps polyrhachis-furcata BCC 54312]
MFWWCHLLVAQLTLVAVVLSRRYFSHLSHVPGPFFASFTRLWHAWHLLVGDMPAQLVRLHEEYGPFVRISHDEISVSHPQAVQQIFISPLHKAPWYKVAAVPDQRFQTPMSTLDPAEKRERSKHVASAYFLSNILRSEDEMDVLLGKFMRWMDRFADEQEPAPLDEFFSYFAYDLVGDMHFSQEFGYLDTGSDVNKSIAAFSVFSAYAVVAGYFPRLLALTVANRLVGSLGMLPMGHLYNTIVQSLDKRRSKVASRFDFVAHWLKEHDKNPSDFSMTDLYAVTVNSILGGSDTTATALQSLTYHIIRHPTAYRRIRDEVDEAQCRDAIVSFEDARKLPYLTACIKEALRVFSPLTLSLARVAGKQGVSIDGRVFRSGTKLSIHPWVEHLSKENWGEDASEFDPDRWLVPEVGAREKHWIPFGAGFNSCPGQHLVKVAIHKMAATLVRDYDIRLVDKTKAWKWKAGMTAAQYGWPVYIERRRTRRQPSCC